MNSTPFPGARVVLTTLCALAVASCDGGRDEATDAPVDGASPQASAVDETGSSATLLKAIDVLDIEGPAHSVALWRHPKIPFESRILVAQGASGLGVFSLTGPEITRIAAPADVVAVAGDQVRVFAIDGESSSLTVFKMDPAGETLTALGSSESPSPIAPTTLLRTNIAALGPAMLRDGRLIRGDVRLPLDAPATTMAASAANFGGVYRRGVAVMAGEDGALRLYALSTLAEALGLSLPDREGPTRGEPVVEGEESGGEQ